MGNAQQFAIDLRKFGHEDLPREVAALQRRLAAELLTGIVMRTPVGNHTKWKNNVARAAKGLPPLPKGYVGGQARRNWQVTLDAAAQSVVAGEDAGGYLAIDAGFVVIGRLQEPAPVWISNPLPYMEPLENGWSRQAPQGIVARSVADLEAKYARVQ